MKFLDCMKQGKTYIIAELSANHGGSYDRAIDIIRAAKEVGADCLKIQTFMPDTLTLDCDNQFFLPASTGLWKGMRSYELYQKAFTPWEWQADLKKECRSVDNVDFRVAVEDCGVLCHYRDTAFALKIVGVHHAVYDLLVFPVYTRLLQHLVHKCCFAVVDMGDNCNISQLVH